MPTKVLTEINDDEKEDLDDFIDLFDYSECSK